MQEREKQIEEMADVYGAARLKARETLGSMNEGEAMWYSKAFYNAGYRKQYNGMWFHYSSTMMECSICRKHTPIRKYDFCPRCGARMKGGAE